MARVITFSRTFPAYHPKKGQPTYFVEKFWKSIWDTVGFGSYVKEYNECFPLKFDGKENIHVHTAKNHTIRAGHRFKVGDKFSPRVWSGKPYQSPQITIAPDIEIKKVWDFEVGPFGLVFINCLSVSDSTFEKLASNDGLTLDELKEWFQYPKPFEGQIICWNETVKY